MSGESSNDHYDIVIAGGGMVGCSLALMLAASFQNYKVLMVEANPQQDGIPASDFTQPSFDARSTALSYSTREIYESIGIWSQLAPDACPISSIQVSDRGHLASTRLNAREQGFEAYGYVVENRQLGRILNNAVAQTAVDVAAPATVTNVSMLRDGVVLTLSDRDQPVCGKLLVIADGARSATRDKLGIAARVSDYHVAGNKQMGLIANVAMAEPHNHVAYERFTDQGPMALLPLIDAGGVKRSALVWTLPANKADYLSTCAETEFVEQLHARFGYRQGLFSGVGERHLYPLKLMTVTEQIRRNIVVAGNAAHNLHPVAGQGFNLAMRDIAALTATLTSGVKIGQSPGDLQLLQRYLDSRQADQDRTVAASDWLPRLFGLSSMTVAGIRGLGLMALDLVPELREQFARYGMGLESPAARV